MKESVLTSAFLKIRAKLRGLAAGITGSSEEAEDVLHDAFCKLWESHPEVENETEAMRLTYATVRNRAIDISRRRLLHPQLSLDDLSNPPSQPETDPEEERDELCEVLLRLSRRVLDERQLRVFTMHDVDNLSYPEIAGKLGLSEDNVRQILSRARRKIRQLYREKYERTS